MTVPRSLHYMYLQSAIDTNLRLGVGCFTWMYVRMLPLLGVQVSDFTGADVITSYPAAIEHRYQITGNRQVNRLITCCSRFLAR